MAPSSEHFPFWLYMPHRNRGIELHLDRDRLEYCKNLTELAN